MTLTYKHRLGRLQWNGNSARPADAPMGRFGGGWHYELGIQTGRRWTDGSISGILNLGTRQYRFAWKGRS